MFPLVARCAVEAVLIANLSKSGSIDSAEIAFTLFLFLSITGRLIAGFALAFRQEYKLF